jgi:hypothetical protein
MLLLLIIIAISFGFARGCISQARKKGYDTFAAGFFGSLFWFIPLIAYSVMEYKHYPCPECGQMNIFYLRTCSKCNHELPQHGFIPIPPPQQ